MRHRTHTSTREGAKISHKNSKHFSHRHSTRCFVFCPYFFFHPLWSWVYEFLMKAKPNHRRKRRRKNPLTRNFEKSCFVFNFDSSHDTDAKSEAKVFAFKVEGPAAGRRTAATLSISRQQQTHNRRAKAGGGAQIRIKILNFPVVSHFLARFIFSFAIFSLRKRFSF